MCCGFQSEVVGDGSVRGVSYLRRECCQAVAVGSGCSGSRSSRRVQGRFCTEMKKVGEGFVETEEVAARVG